LAARRKKLDIILENYIVVFVFIFAEEQINYLEELMQEEMKESMQEQVSEEIPSSEEGTPAVLEGKRKKEISFNPGSDSFIYNSCGYCCLLFCNLFASNSSY